MAVGAEVAGFLKSEFFQLIFQDFDINELIVSRDNFDFPVPFFYRVETSIAFRHIIYGKCVFHALSYWEVLLVIHYRIAFFWHHQALLNYLQDAHVAFLVNFFFNLWQCIPYCFLQFLRKLDSELFSHSLPSLKKNIVVGKLTFYFYLGSGLCADFTVFRVTVKVLPLVS